MLSRCEIEISSANPREKFHFALQNAVRATTNQNKISDKFLFLSLSCNHIISAVRYYSFRFYQNVIVPCKTVKDVLLQKREIDISRGEKKKPKFSFIIYIIT